MNTGTAKAEVLVRGPGEGQATWALGSLFERLASHRETAGTFGLSLVTQPPGAATPVHIHTQEDEAFYVLDGNLTYSADGQIYRLSPGSFIYLPKGLPHAFRVTGDEPVRFLGLVLPGPLMDLYDEIGRRTEQHQLPEPDEQVLGADIQRWIEASPRYGLQIVGPPIPADA
jgi:quercetin dioxygenase-like cupin family protein